MEKQNVLSTPTSSSKNGNPSKAKSLSDESTDFATKLRRLKIEEGVITKSIRCYLDPEDTSEEVCQGASPEVQSGIVVLDPSEYLASTKQSLQEIKSLYDDIKTHVTAEDSMEYMDIDDIRKDILDLEAKIRAMKKNCSTKLMNLKKEEEELIELKNAIITEQKHIASKCTQMKNKFDFNEAVLSPVRSMINAPLKCAEVQQFQEFVRSSKNHYGGWSPYSHNIFVQAWKKYFNSSFKKNSKEMEHFLLNELLSKIPGLKSSDVITHANWYKQYLKLKNEQQNAITQWKNNKKLKELISNVRHIDSKIENCDGRFEKNENSKQSQTSVNSHREIKIKGNMKTSKLRDCKDFKLAVDNKSGYIKSTKQWNSKCNAAKEDMNCSNHLEEIGKLCIPKWRQIMH